ncbi:carbohydrate-binding protein [Pasteurellaceae bacterium 20609_3]|uniref:discoidin domain-containing protein n=1 Tax=Spirabiliibacterium mucosae TaxID=28156 RepID=UPI001AADDD9C|nr:discoidin domain-containing protein [Spirabiliibacterium mucosae]MBE2898180.1 carbohydrate-binding protein [Spirabiliibacterium mucosae]
MQKLTLTLLDKDNNIKLARSDFDEIATTYKGEYAEGDAWVVEAQSYPCFLKVRLEDSFESALLYLTEKLVFTIPFGDGVRVYNSDKAFRGGLHFVWVRTAREYEIQQYGNLAYNPYQQAEQQGVYPCALSNIKPGNIRFAPRNVIDGAFDTNAHGSYPYTSWSNAQDPQAELTIDFGRPVEVDGVVLYLRADFPHDSWWQSITVTFDGEHAEVLEAERTGKAQHYHFSARQCQRITLTNLIKGKEHAPFTALSQLEVLGRNV